MELLELIELFSTQYKLIVTVVALLVFPVLLKLTKKLLEKTIKGKIDIHRKYRAELLLKIILAIVMICLVLVFWGIELRGLLVLGSSLFAMLGVALFAAWSLLSNLTSFLLMFIQNDCRVGYWVRIIDGANFIEGRIVEMGLMNVVLEHIDGHRVIYPNNLFVTRPVMVLNKEPKPTKPVAIKRVIGPKKTL
ncbi:mechanosensitive ion channel protein [Pseudoalteromonas porphyrae]|uniref:Small-conductance mechanosensitive channel n=2 Tax=Pseudoalteromonas TaxID=53246 RepID=A0A0N1MR37_9GAMM|nr:MULTISPECIES: mechanosensitive ion channel domain-containing protein [Pseudoalteromonas]KPH56860.1 mechanosensitive ion channel protein [Pseudoalteromonas porphyrae]KPH93020.1 mechanosensitive ion channel protein [Pseudoalteromonas porphyrae]NNG44245.1 mechanosensitive ion channel [Pseudoalteromonas sp. NEC-BIFX-2020_002]